MSVPVLWISRHDHILSRGYADQGLLEAVLDRSLWSPPAGLEFEHVEDVGRDGAGLPHLDGALVILPARHHASEADVSWFLAELERLSWYVVVLSGDEECVFPWARVPRDDRRKVWVMQPRPEHADMDGLIPGGWYPGTVEGLRQIGADWHDGRHHDWFFAGQVTHARREQMAAALRAVGRGFYHPTAGYLQGMPRLEYLKHLSHTKIAPCPSGPMTVDTARPLEALEAGCVPVVDMVTPRGGDYDYWALCFGDDCPLPRIRDWREFPSILGRELAAWPHTANRCGAWWQGWKRRIVLQLEDQIREAANLPAHLQTPDALVTVLVTTSPIPAHPSTEDIEETIRLIRAQLPGAEIVVAIDGVRPEQEDRTEAYGEYIRRLLWLTNHRWHNVVPYLACEWLHQAALTTEALKLVRTPLVLFVEHDRPPVGEIPWRGLCDAVLSDKVAAIRLHAEAEIHPEHEYLMLDPAPRQVGSVPLRRTLAWWQHPHLIVAERYRGLLFRGFSPYARSMIEDRLYSLYEGDWKDRGKKEAWDRWRVTIYQPEGDMKRSTHLDSRGEDPKFPMHLGAPKPARDFQLGLIVRLDNRGLGTQTWELYRHLEPERVLAVSMGPWSPSVEEHRERFPDARVTSYDGQGGHLPMADIEWLLGGSDVVLTAETPYDHRVYDLARQRGVRTVCQPNPEFWRPTLDPNLPLPDLCANPSRWRESAMPGVHLPHPVDRERLPFRLRTEAKRFLHVHGHAASNDRQGTELILEALTYCRTTPDLTIRTQTKLGSLAGRMARVVERRGRARVHLLRGDPPDYWDLYEGYDVLLAPRRYGGLSLPMQEAASAGLVVLAADREPERFDLPAECLIPLAETRSHRYPGGDILIESADPKVLAERIDELVETPALVERLSQVSDVYAESISWDRLLPQWEALLERVMRMETSDAVGVRV